ncbi:MAG: hypothetical protein AB7F98_10440 [Novosphingobium sp.]
MTRASYFAHRFAAVASAFTLSILLFAGAVSVPQPASAATHTAFVGVVA